MARKDDVEILGQFQLGSSEPPPVRKIPFWKKKLFLTFALIVSVAGIGLFVHEKQHPSGVRQAAVPSAPALSNDRDGVSRNPEYRRKIDELNRERTSQAIRTGQSSVPTLGGGDRKTESLSLSNPGPGGQSSGNGKQVPTPSEAKNRMQEERQAIRTARTEEEAAVGKEIGGVLSTWSTAGDNLGLLAANVSKPVKSRAAGGKTGNSVKGVSKTGKNIPIIPAGKILYGRIINELNSDHPGPVLAQAVGGKFDGVKFLGSFQRDHGALVIKFDRVIYKDGETDSIGAYAVSPGTKLRSGLETEVDHHYLYRYGALLGPPFSRDSGSRPCIRTRRLIRPRSVPRSSGSTG
ncbi:DotG/IcmE/VirB10 family protein [Leptospirillum ferriphilum]|uniref:DotG/IcmE/VirB10 family protein n=1 Tax=Leptospirillum ferriphilum TaxID=178606 RepID=UPI0006B161EC|nr:DotG/IcmE/VirB10 family protein [Leptospirillum ferriphilum]